MTGAEAAETLARRKGDGEEKHDRERQPEQETHLRRADRAERADQLALHRVAQRLRPDATSVTATNNSPRPSPSPLLAHLTPARAIANSAPEARAAEMAVYTEVTDEALTAFLAGYDLGRASSLKA